MKTEIPGIIFTDDGYSITAVDGLASMTILAAHEQEQSFIFYDTEIEKFSQLFEDYNCTSLSIVRSVNGKAIDIGAIRFPERIKKLSFELSVPAVLTCTANTNPFCNVSSIRSSGSFFPAEFPDMHSMSALREFSIKYDKNNFEIWTNLKQIEDLCIVDYNETDLVPLQGLSGLRRLRLENGKMRRLDGVESFPKLETLFVAKASKLDNINAILSSKSIKNILFAHYTKTKDWSFLARKTDLQRISLDNAESVDFMKYFPELEFLYCKKVQDKNNKGFLFSTKLHQDIMTPDGIQVSYIPVCEQFYQPLPS